MALSRIRAAVSIDKPVAAVTISAPGSSTGLTVNSLTPAVTKLIPLAAVKWVLIQYTAEIDFRGLNPTPVDIFVVTDTAVLSVSKAPSETLGAIDELAPFVLGKGITDNQTTAEQTSYDLQRGITDTANLLDTPAYLFVTSRSDSWSVADTTAVTSGKVFLDKVIGQREGPNTGVQTYAALDYFAEDYVAYAGPAFHVFKSASDLISHVDTQTLVFGKGLTETKVTTEDLDFDISKVLADTVDATDDFDGEASAEDDQTMSFITGRSEVLSTSDVFLQEFNKGLTEAKTAADSGSLRMTDYCDVNYFAADYVGTSLTF